MQQINITAVRKTANCYEEYEELQVNIVRLWCYSGFNVFIFQAQNVHAWHMETKKCLIYTQRVLMHIWALWLVSAENAVKPLQQFYIKYIYND